MRLLNFASSLSKYDDGMGKHCIGMGYMGGIWMAETCKQIAVVGCVYVAEILRLGKVTINLL